MDKFGRLTRFSEWIPGNQYRLVHRAYRRTIKVNPEVYDCLNVVQAVSSPGGNNRPGYVELKVGGKPAVRWSHYSWHGRFILQKVRVPTDANGLPRGRWQGEVHFLSGSYATLQGTGCYITLEGRPHYCDRGNYLAKLHVEDPRLVHVDDQDGWPRFYFDLDRSMAECEAWMRKRGLLTEGAK